MALMIHVPTTEPNAPTIDPERAAKAAIIPEFMGKSQTANIQSCACLNSPNYQHSLGSGRHLKPCVDRNCSLEKLRHRTTGLSGFDGGIEFRLARAGNLS